MGVEPGEKMHLPVRMRIAVGIGLAALASAIVTVSSATGSSAAPGPRLTIYSLANRCLALRSVSTRRFVAAGSERVDAGGLAGAEHFDFEATGLGTYMLYDRAGKVLGVRGRRVSPIATPGPPAAFAARIAAARSGATVLTLRSLFDHRLLATARSGALGVTGSAGLASEFTLTSASGCRPFPEAQVDAVVHGPGKRLEHGQIFGFIDDHVHVTGNRRAGGDVISGEPYDPFGITVALGQDAKVHGPNGSLDITGNLLRTGNPTGTHDTHGWPSFKGWPTYDSMTHQQAYYVWLERAWRAGMRMMVAQTADDEPLCRLEPRKAVKSCSETVSVEDQIRTLKGMQSYIDAQSGGPGRGWFRLVYTPAEAQNVMEEGKLAVLIGIESSDLFGCSVSDGRPQCTRADIDHGLAHYKRLGVRGMFVAHWVNNAFGGAALEGGIKGLFINILNRFQTGSYFQTGPCPGPGQGVTVATLPQSVLEGLVKYFPAAKSIAAQPMPTYPAGLQCNAEGLTPLGRYLIKRMIAEHMLIEVDHLSEIARDQVLAIAAQAHYPLVSSHNGTGGEWTPAELQKLYALGGFAAVTPDDPAALAAKITAMAANDTAPHAFVGVGLGTDTNGFSSLPGPPPDAASNPLRYPFRSYDGSVTFTRERTGTRTFDLNRDGVAQYGLIADLIGDMEQTPADRSALPLLFNSAQAYLDMWRRAYSHR